MKDGTHPLCCPRPLSSQMLVSSSRTLCGGVLGSEQRTSVPGFQNPPFNSPRGTHLYKHRVDGLAFELFQSWAVGRKSGLGPHFVQKKKAEEHIKMAKRHMTRCSTSSTIKEMQIKTTVSYYLTPVRMAIVKKTRESRCWLGCGEKGTLLHYWWECTLVQPLWRTVWRFLKKLEIDPLSNPAIPFPSIYSKK